MLVSLALLFIEGGVQLNAAGEATLGRIVPVLVEAKWALSSFGRERWCRSA